MVQDFVHMIGTLESNVGLECNERIECCFETEHNQMVVGDLLQGFQKLLKGKVMLDHGSMSKIPA